MLGLCGYVRAFSSFSEWGLLSSCSVWASQCDGFSCCRAQALGMHASVAVARGLGCSAVCGIFPDQGLNPCHLQWQADFFTAGSPGMTHHFLSYKKKNADNISVL